MQVSTPAVEGDPSSGNFSFGYDTAGTLTSQTSSTGEDPPEYREVGYELDENGNRTKLTWPDTYYAQYFLDELNRLKDIKLNGSGSAAFHFYAGSLRSPAQVYCGSQMVGPEIAAEKGATLQEAADWIGCSSGDQKTWTSGTVC